MAGIDVLKAWQRQLADNPMLSLALQEGMSVQVVLYVDTKGKVGLPKITVR